MSTAPLVTWLAAATSFSDVPAYPRAANSRVASSSSAERVLYPDRVTPERQQEMLDDLLGRLRP